MLWSLYGGLREERSAGLGIAIARLGEGEGRGMSLGGKPCCYCSARCVVDDSIRRSLELELEVEL
jgi:hypothetical protein